MKEAAKGPGMRFNIGDYVMVSATKNQANRQRHNKNMVRWQGPYEITGVAEAPAKFQVRLVGTKDVKKVHWQKLIRIAGPGLFVSQAVQNAALHDLQRGCRNFPENFREFSRKFIVNFRENVR